MNAPTESYTRLQRKWLLIARLAWATIALLATIMHVAALPVAFNLLRTSCYQGPCDTPFQTPVATESIAREEADLQGAWQSSLWEVTVWLLTLGVAVFIFWRRSDDWMAHLASIMLVTIIAVLSPWPEMLADNRPLWYWPRALLWLIGLASTVGLFYLFPDGRFVPRWTRGLAISFLLIIVILAAAGGPFLAGFPIFVVVLITGTVFQVYRYRRVSSPMQRQQTKWVVLGIIAMLVPMFVTLLFAFLNPSLDPLLHPESRSPLAEAVFSLMVIFGLVIPLCFLPVTLAFSLLRYRLWDVDIFINRALVYGVLTTSVVGFYVLIVGGLSTLLQTQNNFPNIIIAILLIAFLFQPLRRYLQQIVNRFLPVPKVIIGESIPPPVPQTKQEQKNAIADSTPSTILRGRWLIFARMAWVTGFGVLTVMYALGFLAVHDALSTVCREESCSLRQQLRRAEVGEQVMDWGGPPEGYADPLHPAQVQVLETLGLTLEQYGWLGALQLGIPALVYLLIAAGLFWWKSDDWMVLFASTMIATFPFVDMPLPYTLTVRQPVWGWVHTPLNVVAVSCFFIFPLIFPTGQVVPRWTRWKLFSDIAFAIIGTLVRDSILRPPPSWGAFVFPYIVLSLVINAYAQSYRYLRVASPVERQQIKWVVVGVVGFISIAFPVDRFLYYHPIIIDSGRALLMSAIPDTIYRAITLFIPVSIAISVFRYRLWDIDIIINRALVYGALTAGVVGLYVLIVGWLSIRFQTVPANVFAIIAIAFLLQPLRQRLQGIVDRFVPMPQSALPFEQQEHRLTIPERQGMDTKLHGRWLILARLAWAAVFIALTAMYTFGFLAVRDALSTVCEREPCTLIQQIRHTEAGEKVESWPGPSVGYANPLRPDQVEALETLGLMLDQYGWLGALQMGLPLLLYLLIAAGLFWRKSDDWMVLFASLMVATVPVGPVPLPFTLVVRQPAWEWFFDLTFMVAISCLFVFPLIFPTGRFVPHWTRWMVLFDIAFAVIVTLFRNSASENPDAASLVLVYLLIAFGTGIYAQLYRYFRVASPVERQQLKWVIVGMAGFVGISVGVLEPLNALLTSAAVGMSPARALLLSVIPDTIFQVILLFIPVSLAISVMRYRLWDIDIIINRTLVYGALTGMIFIAFVIIVGFLSFLVQSSGNSIVAIVATGLVALLFHPLRQRLQQGINHLMYGERDDPYAALSRLGRRLEASLAPEAVLPTVVTTVREVLKLPYVAIYLKHEDGNKIAAESASPSLRSENGKIHVPGMDREGLCVPLIHQGETLGYVVLGPRAPNEAFSTTDLHLLDDLAPQVGVAVHAVRLTADLQRSRERLVLAREEERRRLRRDLHDDLGPTLASFGLAASTVADLIPHDPAAATRLVKELENQMRATVGNVRKLVYDLRPPTLDELGLLPAVRERASRFSNAPNGFHVTVDAPAELPALPAAVEVAAYRIVQEALENVSKHAQARQCTIRFANQSGLEIEITDDGIGLPPNITRGVGLRSMRERAEELGGSCVIERGVNCGTHVLACLPIGEFDGSFAHSYRR